MDIVTQVSTKLHPQDVDMLLQLTGTDNKAEALRIVVSEYLRANGYTPQTPVEQRHGGDREAVLKAWETRRRRQAERERTKERVRQTKWSDRRMTG